MGDRLMNKTEEGNQVLNLPVNGLSSGVYIVRIIPENGNSVVKKISIIN